MTISNDTSGQARAAAPNPLPVDAARTLIRQAVRPVEAVERVALRAALDRVLAENIVSPIDVPAHDNAAMDGYAFDGAALSGSGAAAEGQAPFTLVVAGEARAGHPFDRACGLGECVRIMTGAPMPAGCDTVVPQELVTRTGSNVAFDTRQIVRGANCRRAGEDLARGRAALEAGRILRPADLGLLASLGVAEVAVRRRVRVAFFSTGDELRSVGEPLDTGCVYDSNRYTLYAMLTRMNVEVLDLGVVRDEPGAIEAALRAAAACVDVVLTSGGVSVGDADFTARMTATFGDVAFWQLAMRPGRPLAFGRLSAGAHASSEGGALFFGLPGNPVAVMVSFYQFVRGALIAMSGANAPGPLQFAAASSAPIKKRPGRTEFLRGVATRDGAGQWSVVPTPAQGSGVLSSMSRANCFIVLGHDQGDVAAGAPVDIIPFEGLV
ncbi:gephyrin-like molybdotransferase Glp [Trinickia dinghuensis]|uniref:Molybdopterin molybdenumtransferase n=1 Tax=Trinickia dinghuensis TaxID=2291023 RepID=A0A3D8JX22_9BURK|nr:gephyrin-like molybdotransferase Glp [Trinickia dinghuensis]RDU97184.1 molybdopterin molybdenumtransferase MoeA [Trinickia dinghuensis]